MKAPETKLNLYMAILESSNQEPIFHVSEYGPSLYPGHVLVASRTVTIPIPDDFDPLQASIDRLTEQANDFRVEALKAEDKAQKLLALPAPAEYFDPILEFGPADYWFEGAVARWFSFGSSHLDREGNSLHNRYVIIWGDDYADCRRKMYQLRGTDFCTDYDMDDLARQQEAYGLTESRPELAALYRVEAKYL